MAALRQPSIACFINPCSTGRDLGFGYIEYEKEFLQKVRAGLEFWWRESEERGQLAVPKLKRPGCTHHRVFLGHGICGFVPKCSKILAIIVENLICILCDGLLAGYAFA